MGLTLEDERVRVLAHFLTEGSVRRGTKRGSCTGFDIELHIQSQEKRSQVEDLIAQAHRMCYTEATLASEVKIQRRNFLNGEPF